MAPAACTSRLLFGLLHVAAALGNVGCAGLSSNTFPKEVVEGASRHTRGGRKVLADSGSVVKTIFSNGWAPGCSWVASGAFNISVVPGVGVGQSSGLCTTFPEAEGWMSFACSDPDLTSALQRSSGIQFYISQLSGSQIGSSDPESIIPKGLSLILQDANNHFTCRRPVGSAGDINDGLVQTSVLFKGSLSNPNGNDQDCRPALHNASSIGFVSSNSGITFCSDNIQLI